MKLKIIYKADKLETKEELEMKNKGKIFCYVHYMIGYCGNRLENYLEMFKEVKKTFPDITEKDIICSKIYKCNIDNGKYLGYTIVAFSGFIDDKEYEDWQYRKLAFFDYIY